MKNLGEMFLAGGFFMWPILLCSAIGLAIVIERFFVLRTAKNVSKGDLVRKLKSSILKGSLDQALAIVSKTPGPLTNIVKAGLTAAKNGGGSEEVQTSMDAVALREVPRLERRIGLLATVANVSTLLGLLGTVSGLIAAFAAVAHVAPAEKASLLSNAIAEAMNTTAFGLIVAVPILAAYGYLNALAQNVIDDLHETSVSTLNFILTHKSELEKVSNG